jgi:hypothetical protein
VTASESIGVQLGLPLTDPLRERLQEHDRARRAAQPPKGDVHVRRVRGERACVVCSVDVAHGELAECWPTGPAHLRCGSDARRAR